MNTYSGLRLVSALVASASLMLGLVQPARSADEAKVLNVYNWADYLPDDMLKNFEKETGIKVNYNTYDSNEILHAKLVAGRSGYDIVVPSANWAGLQIKAGYFQKLDKSQLPNLKNVDPVMAAQLAKVDPGNQYLVNWAWGYVTLGINQDKVKAALGSLPMPDNAWDLFFDPKYSSKLKSCGISMLDSATDVYPSVLHYIGKNPYSTTKADYDAANKALLAIRPSIRVFSSGINELANGSLCMAFGYSGDMNIAAKRAADGKTKQNVVALVPKTGAVVFLDSMAIPADAQHVKNAHIFINYILRPEVAASITNKMTYATMNLAADKFVDKDLRENKSIFLSAEDKQRMVPSEVVDNNTRRVMTRLFTQFKTGH